MPATTSPSIVLTQDDKDKLLRSYNISNITRVSDSVLEWAYDHVVEAGSLAETHLEEFTPDMQTVIQAYQKRIAKYHYVKDCVEAEAKRRGLTL